MRPSITAALALSTALLALGAAAPPASAQFEIPINIQLINYSPYVENPDFLRDGRLPAHTHLIWGIDVRVSIPELMGQGVGVCPLTPIPVRFSASGPEYATVTVSPEVDYVFLSTGGRSYADIFVDMTISTSEQAPAFFSDEYTFHAQALRPSSTLAGCMLSQSPQLTVEVAVTNDYIARIDASSDEWQGRTPAPIHVENWGNGQTRVRFAWLTADGNSVPSSKQVLLNTPLLSKTGTSADVLLPRSEIPRNWNRGIMVEASSSIACGTCQSEWVTLTV